MKSLKIFFAVLLTVVTITHSQPSKAAVGALVSTPILIAGLYITAVTGGTTIYSYISCNRGDHDESGLCSAVTLLFGLPLIALGLIVLDGEQGVQFQSLSLEQANQLGVSEAELAIYNSEVDQANMLIEEVKTELSQQKNPTEQDSVVAWNNLKDLVSPETFATMQKIVSQKQ